jgi:hypothetical protein
MLEPVAFEVLTVESPETQQIASVIEYRKPISGDSRGHGIDELPRSPSKSADGHHVITIGIEHLDTIVPAINDKDSTVPVDCYVQHVIERRLTGIATRPDDKVFPEVNAAVDTLVQRDRVMKEYREPLRHINRPARTP